MIEFIDITNADVLSGSTSKGNQPKWFLRDRDIFVKGRFSMGGVYFDDWKVECIASILCKALGIDIVEYYPCQTQYGNACYSYNFLREDESYITFDRLANYVGERSYTIKMMKMSTIERIEYCRDLIGNVTNLDVTSYLHNMAGIDYLVGNEDRHFNNFGVIQGLGYFREAPLFDFGLGLFEHDEVYRNLKYIGAKKHMRGQPFNRDLKKALKAFGELPNFGIDVQIPNTYIPSELGLKYLQETTKELGICLEIV